MRCVVVSSRKDRTGAPRPSLRRDCGLPAALAADLTSQL